MLRKTSDINNQTILIGQVYSPLVGFSLRIARAIRPAGTNRSTTRLPRTTARQDERCDDQNAFAVPGLPEVVRDADDVQTGDRCRRSCSLA